MAVHMDVCLIMDRRRFPPPPCDRFDERATRNCQIQSRATGTCQRPPCNARFPNTPPCNAKSSNAVHMQHQSPHQTPPLSVLCGRLCLRLDMRLLRISCFFLFEGVCRAFCSWSRSRLRPSGDVSITIPSAFTIVFRVICVRLCL